MGQSRFSHWVRNGALIAGPVLALGVYAALPATFSDQAGEAVPFSTAGRATLAVMVWMAIWWLTEAIEITATALLPLVLFPLSGVASMADAAAPYAHDLIFLFAGGFVLALAMQRWGLDRRIALSILSRVGTRPAGIVLGFMIATAGLSAFVSNTATAAMMLPIGLSVIALLHQEQSGRPRGNFALCLMLAIAYAASIGGIATIIGSPPNAILVANIAATIDAPYQRDIGFAEWMVIGVPLSVVFLPLAWLLLTRVVFSLRKEPLEGAAELIRDARRSLGPFARGEIMVAVIFGLTAFAWGFRPLLQRITIGDGAEALRPLAGLSDAGIAMIAALALFVIPVAPARREFLMDWETARRLPFSILVLFGGGLSLAAAVKTTGVGEFLASGVLAVGAIPALLMVVLVTTAVVFLTELTSNTATTATLVPLLAALAPGLGLHPYLLIIPAALAASCAFMMPVATPPNAIVFGSGHITIPQMCRAGLLLNLLAIVLIVGLLYAIVVPWFGIG